MNEIIIRYRVERVGKKKKSMSSPDSRKYTGVQLVDRSAVFVFIRILVIA